MTLLYCAHVCQFGDWIFASILPRDIFNTYLFPHLVIFLFFESNGSKKVSPNHCGLLPFLLYSSFFVPTLYTLPLPINHWSTMASSSASPQAPQSPYSPYSAPSPADSQAPQQGLDGVVIEADVCMIVLSCFSFLFPFFRLSFFQLVRSLCLPVCMFANPIDITNR